MVTGYTRSPRSSCIGSSSCSLRSSSSCTTASPRPGGAWCARGRSSLRPVVFSHIAFGVAVLVLVVWRMAIKARRGAPALPENEPALAEARGPRHASGALRAADPDGSSPAGSPGSAGSGWSAEVHEVLKTLLLLLVALHVAGALYQQFVLKSDVLKRMGRPEA